MLWIPDWGEVSGGSEAAHEVHMMKAEKYIEDTQASGFCTELATICPRKAAICTTFSIDRPELFGWYSISTSTTSKDPGSKAT